MEKSTRNIEDKQRTRVSASTTALVENISDMQGYYYDLTWKKEVTCRPKILYGEPGTIGASCVHALLKVVSVNKM